MPGEIYSQLKKKILFFEYTPGCSLTVRDLAREFGTSITPIREALILLEAEGLVHRVPNRSIQVSYVSPKDIKEIFEFRLFLLELVARLATRRATDAEIRELQNLAARLKSATRRSELLSLDDLLHQKLNLCTRNKGLVSSLERVRNQGSRLWYYMEEHSECETRFASDFEAILQALRERNEQRVYESLADHVKRFMTAVQGVVLLDLDTKKT